ncbi:fasciclin domain-containing protein [Pontibacter mangrovi]|uniref:Fasciclin domain-containing protein n=1 Tax=Pontibacter mangrovi TaxID=2589816 RepID=A0A501VW07_9BACT|nr:fasciclin domain-containing protein [Pontibacter mangrovi]TPE40585.1 fasciclin domain-containing protein [Pontibacter mangrovi]
MKTLKHLALAVALCGSAAMVSCGTRDDNAANELQEETKPNPGGQEEAKMTNPNTPGKQAGEGELGGDPVDASMTGVQVGGQEMVPSKNIVQNISSDSNLQTLAAALRQAGLVNTLNGSGPYTIFAPTNDAFKAMPEDELEKLMEASNKDQLAALLKNHVVAGKLTAADLTEGTTLKTLGGQQLNVTAKGDDIMVNGAKVVQADAMSQNGVIHIVEKVLTEEKM